jgi:PAS domain S-box-containing protein
MNDQRKTKKQLLDELTDLRRRVAEQETEIVQHRRAEADQKQIDDNLPVLVTLAGFDGYPRKVNAAFQRTLGWSEQELLSRPFMEFIFPEDRPAAEEVFERVKTGGAPIVVLVRTLCKDGSHRWINWNAVSLPNRDLLFGAGKDVTERKQAEEALRRAHGELEQHVAERTAELLAANEALRESEQKFKTLVEMSPDAVVMCDATGRVTFASPRALQLYGTASLDEMLAMNPLDFFAPADHQKFLNNVRKTLEEGETRDEEYVFVRKDGTHLIGEASAAAITGAPGKPKGFVAVLRDITERKRVQEALEQERQSLWKMLQASDHERQTISYDIHDGLAQYLAAAGMEFQAHDTMRIDAPDAAQKAYKTAVELVRRAHSESRRLISEVRHPVIDEKGLATAIVSLACEQQQRGGPRIECRTNVQFDRLPPIMENALYRMVQEALTNACKHSRSDEVSVTMIQEGPDVRIEVRDWGIGFDTEATEKGRFGLESIRQRARLLGARLAIESEPGSGTLVQVVTPILRKQNVG